MPIPPSALSYEELAGEINDYTTVVDPTTDLPAGASNKERAAVAAMSRMTPQLYVEWTNDGTNGIVTQFDSVVGNSDAYKPTITREALGQWRFTFSAFVNDLMGLSQPWNFKNAEACALDGLVPLHLQCFRVAPNIIDVFIRALPGAIASDGVGTNMLVRIY